MKLEGIRVIDLSMFLPGPYLTLAMADHGAEVIKVESPVEGDPGRHIGLADGEHTVFFRNLNRGKKSVQIDLKSEAGLRHFQALCLTADVVVESFRPGVAKRLGVDYDAVSRINPRVVYCSISAFGQHGRYAGRPAHDLAVESMAGLISLSQGQDHLPALPSIPIADVVSSLHGLSGVLMALLRRQQTGRGDFIDISMLDSSVAASLNVVGPVFAEGRQPVPHHERTTGGAAFYRLYATRDGGHIALAGQEEKFIRNLLNALQRPDLIDLCLAGPGPHQQPVADFLQATFLTRSRDEWETYLAGLDVCYGPVRSLPEAYADPDLAARGMVVKDAEGLTHIGSPIHFRDEPAVPTLRAPRLGQHNEEFTTANNPQETR